MEDGPTDGGTIWMTYAEIAERTGVTVASAQRRVLRAKWARQPGNDGKARIAVPRSVLSEPPTTPPDASAPVSAPDPVTVGRLLNRIEALETSLEGARRAREADRESWATERAELREALARREGELEGLKAALARPAAGGIREALCWLQGRLSDWTRRKRGR